MSYTRIWIFFSLIGVLITMNAFASETVTTEELGKALEPIKELLYIIAVATFGVYGGFLFIGWHLMKHTNDKVAEVERHKNEMFKRTSEDIITMEGLKEEVIGRATESLERIDQLEEGVSHMVTEVADMRNEVGRMFQRIQDSDQKKIRIMEELIRRLDEDQHAPSKEG